MPIAYSQAFMPWTAIRSNWRLQSFQDAIALKAYASLSQESAKRSSRERKSSRLSIELSPAEATRARRAAKRSFAVRGSQTEFGNQGNGVREPRKNVPFGPYSTGWGPPHFCKPQCKHFLFV